MLLPSKPCFADVTNIMYRTEPSYRNLLVFSRWETRFDCHLEKRLTSKLSADECLNLRSFQLHSTTSISAFYARRYLFIFADYLCRGAVVISGMSSVSITARLIRALYYHYIVRQRMHLPESQAQRNGEQLQETANRMMNKHCALSRSSKYNALRW